MALHKLAHRDALNGPRPLDGAFVANFDRVVRLFDTLLERFETRYATVYERLDMLLSVPVPSATDIDLLQQKIPNTPRTLGYFFERLAHVGWLEPLRAAGFFRAAPPPDIDPVRNTIGFPHWMAADYLARVAGDRPADVVAILTSLPDIENVRVQAQLIDLMLILRAEDRVQLAPVVIQWVRHLARYHWGDHAARFATALTHDGSLDLAFTTATVMLDLPAPDADGVRQPVHVVEYRAERERAEHLRDAATTLVPALLEADALRTITLLADALDYHVGRRPDHVDADPTATEGLTDFSTLWADDLGERERLDASDLRVYLVHVLLAAMRNVGLRMPGRLGDALAILRARGARVLRRIELASLTALVKADDHAVTAAALPHAVDRLTTRALVVEPDLDAEYGALLQATIPKIDGEDRSRVLAALEPPDFSWVKEPEHQRYRAAVWRRDRLALIADHLADPERNELAALTREEGAPEALGHRGSRIESFTGPGSPLDDAALRSMDASELLDFLRAWVPRSGFAEASPEGLGRRLTSIVADNPTMHVSWAPLFIGAQPTYARSILDGFATAARAGKAFPWPDVLTLAAWVVDQPFPEDDTREGDHADFERDPDWRSARRTVADLLGLALEGGAGEDGSIPLDESERVWRMIVNLAEDPNPSPAHEARYGGTNMDPSMLAINTTRPEAIHAAIHFAHWRAGYEPRPTGGRNRVVEDRPEVAHLLLAHLDPTRDPSLAVRAAIGRWLTSFARTDPEWLRQNAEALLPSAPEERERRDALWDAFVQWAQPHPDALAILDPYYRTAIERIGSPHDGRQPEAADNRLAEHVVALYWWGAVSLDAPDNLIDFFFSHADGERRAHAVKHIGYSLYHTEKPVAKEPVALLQRLWEWRVPQLISAAQRGDQALDGAQDREDARTELRAFGWWFSSGAFDAEWALREFGRVLDVTGGVELEHAAAERLAELAPAHPTLAVRSLAAIDFTGGAEPWAVHSWLEHVPTIVRCAFRSGDPEARQMGRSVVNRAVAAGHLELRGLLAEESDE